MSHHLQSALAQRWCSNKPPTAVAGTQQGRALQIILAAQAAYVRPPATARRSACTLPLLLQRATPVPQPSGAPGSAPQALPRPNPTPAAASEPTSLPRAPSCAALAL